MQLQTVNGSPVQPGKTVIVFPPQLRAADTYQADFAVDSAGIILSVYVTAIAGTIDISMYTVTGDGETPILTIPTISTTTSTPVLFPTSNLFLSTVRVRVVTTGDAVWEIRARATPSVICNDGVESVNGQTGIVLLDTDDIPEGSINLYYTNARARAALSGISPISYNNTNGQISLTTVPINLGGTGQTTANNALNALLPSQATNAGKALLTDGTNTSWQTISTLINSVSDTSTIDLTVSLGDLSATLIGFGSLDTDDLTEGTTNLYYTNARVLAYADAAATSNSVVKRDGFANFAAGTITATLNGVANNVSGIVAIANGGTGQSNVQAAINNLSNSALTANEGDVFQWLGGNAQFAAYTAPGTTGTPNVLSYYNSSGDLTSYNYWLAADDGRIGGSYNVTGDNQSLFRLDPNIAVADTWDSVSMLSGTFNNSGTLNGFNSLVNINWNLSSAVSTAFINGLNIGVQGDVTGDKQYANFYSNGTIGANLSGIYLNSDDIVTGNTNMISINRTNTSGGDFIGINQSLNTGATVTGNAYFYNLGVNSNVNLNATILNANFQGAIANGFNGVAFTNSGNIGSGTDNANGFLWNIQNTATIGGNLTGFALNNAATITGNNTIFGTSINNQGAGYRYSAFSSSNNANMSEEIRGFQHNTTGDSRTSTGIDVYMQGNATDDAQGIRVNVSNQTSNVQRVRSLDIQGATFSFNNSYRPASGLFVDSGNNNFSEFRIANGSPVTNTDVLMNSTIVAYLAEDDMAIGPVGLGIANLNSISLLGVADTKTIDKIRGFLVVASVQNLGYADNGTVTDYEGIVYAGALAGGGNTAITNAVGLLMPAGFDGYASNNYGFRIQGTTAENFVNKLAIGTPSETAGTGLALDVYGQLGISAIGSGLSIAEGTNAKMGIITLVAGTFTVNTTAVTANSRILLSRQTAAGTLGHLATANVIAGTSFDIVSDNAGDTSDVAYLIVEAI